MPLSTWLIQGLTARGSTRYAGKEAHTGEKEELVTVATWLGSILEGLGLWGPGE